MKNKVLVLSMGFVFIALFVAVIVYFASVDSNYVNLMNSLYKTSPTLFNVIAILLGFFDFISGISTFRVGKITNGSVKIVRGVSVISIFTYLLVIGFSPHT